MQNRPNTISMIGQLRTLVYLTLVILTCTSCSIFGSEKADSLPIPDYLSQSEQRISLELLSDSPYLYRISTTEGGSAYSTIIEDCSSSSSSSLAALSRQLFVGFENVRIQSMESREIHHQDYTIASASAELDGAPVGLVVYSTLSGRCVRDYAMWTPLQENTDPSLQLDSALEILVNSHPRN